MTRRRPEPPVAPADAAELPLDALVRRYPELLAPLRAASVDPADGVVPLAAQQDEAERARLLRLIAARTAWRSR